MNEAKKTNDKKRKSEILKSFPTSRVLDFSITAPHLGPVSLYKLVQHVVAQCENELFAFIDEFMKGEHLTDKNEHIYKKTLVARERLMRLAALIRWSKTGTQGMHKRQEEIQELNNILMAYQDAANQLFVVDSGTRLAQKPIHDIPNAVDVLNTGSYQRMPRILDQHHELHSSAKRINKVIDDLTNKMRLKILQENVPEQMEIVTIKNTKLKIRVPHEFEMVLTLARDEDESKNWFYYWKILKLNILVNRYNIVQNPLDQQHINRLLQLLQTRIYKKLIKYPFVDIYQWVHNICMRIGMDIVSQQAQQIAAKSNGEMQYQELYDDGSQELRILLNYWKHFPKFNDGLLYYTHMGWAGEAIIYVGDSTTPNVKDIKIDHRPILENLPSMDPSKIDIHLLISQLKRQVLLDFWDSIRSFLKSRLFRTVHIVDPVDGEIHLEVFLVEQYRLSMFIDHATGRIRFEIYIGHHLVTSMMGDNKYQFEFMNDHLHEKQLALHFDPVREKIKLMDIIHNLQIQCILHSLHESAKLLDINMYTKNEMNFLRKYTIEMLYMCCFTFPGAPDVYTHLHVAAVKHHKTGEPFSLNVIMHFPTGNGQFRTKKVAQRFFLRSLHEHEQVIPFYRDDDDDAPPVKKQRITVYDTHAEYFDTTFDFLKRFMESQRMTVKRHLIHEHALLYKVVLNETETNYHYTFNYPFLDNTPLKALNPRCELTIEEDSSFYVNMEVPMGNLQLPYDFDDGSIDMEKLKEQSLVIVQYKQQNKFQIRFNFGPYDSFEAFVSLAKKLHYMSTFHARVSQMTNAYVIQVEQQTPTFIHFKYGMNYNYSCLLTYDTIQKKYMLNFNPEPVCAAFAIDTINDDRYDPSAYLGKILSSVATTVLGIQTTLERNYMIMNLVADSLVEYSIKIGGNVINMLNLRILLQLDQQHELKVTLEYMEPQQKKTLVCSTSKLNEKIELILLLYRWNFIKFLIEKNPNSQKNQLKEFSVGDIGFKTYNELQSLRNKIFDIQDVGVDFDLFKVQKFFKVDLSVQKSPSNILNDIFNQLSTVHLSDLGQLLQYTHKLLVTRHEDLSQMLTTPCNDAQCRISKIHLKVPSDVKYPQSFNEILRSPQIGAPVSYTNDFRYFVRLTSLHDDASYVDLPFQCIDKKCLLNAPYINSPNLEADRLGEQLIAIGQPIQIFMASCLRQSIATLLSL